MSIKIKNLTKTYGKVTALDHVSFSIKPNQIFGLLGPNGAGKSTFIRILSQLSYPDSGEILVQNRPIKNQNAKAMIGLVPQMNNLHKDLTVYENLLYHGLYYGMDKKEAKEKAGKLMADFGLTGKGDQPLATLSGGMRQRALIARALMQSPDILIMDEPTVGLDPLIRKELWSIIKKLGESHIVLLTTQYIEEADALCDEVAILDEGKLVVQGTPSGLKTDVGEMVIEFTMKSEEEIHGFVRQFSQEFKNMDITGKQIRISADKAATVQIIEEITDKGAENIQYHETTLEDVFMKHTHKAMHERI